MLERAIRSSGGFELPAALTAAGVAIAAGDLWLVLICWKRRSVLGGLLGAISMAIVAFAIFSGPSHGRGKDALAIAAIALVIATALYGLGQALQRLLDEEPEDSI
jgi:peptidoglycan/LPS O-acetylase OafA/YrhL